MQKVVYNNHRYSSCIFSPRQLQTQLHTSHCLVQGHVIISERRYSPTFDVYVTPIIQDNVELQWKRSDKLQKEHPVGYGWKETRRTGSYPMRGSDHMSNTDPPPWECPGLKGSKHSVTGGAQLRICLMWMCRVLFHTFITFWETSDFQESLDDNWERSVTLERQIFSRSSLEQGYSVFAAHSTVSERTHPSTSFYTTK